MKKTKAQSNVLATLVLLGWTKGVVFTESFFPPEFYQGKKYPINSIQAHTTDSIMLIFQKEDITLQLTPQETLQHIIEINDMIGINNEIS